MPNVDIGARALPPVVVLAEDRHYRDRPAARLRPRAQVGVAQANTQASRKSPTFGGKRCSPARPSRNRKPIENPPPSQSIRRERFPGYDRPTSITGTEETPLERSAGASFAGTITARNIDIGDLINVGGTRELFHLAQMEKLRVYVRVPQTQAADIRAGQAAELLVPELPDEPFPATVTTTSEAVSNTSRTLLTELQADNSKGRIRIGSYAQVRFASITAAPALTLSKPAQHQLIFRAEGLQVGGGESTAAWSNYARSRTRPARRLRPARGNPPAA